MSPHEESAGRNIHQTRVLSFVTVTPRFMRASLYCLLAVSIFLCGCSKTMDTAGIPQDLAAAIEDFNRAGCKDAQGARYIAAKLYELKKHRECLLFASHAQRLSPSDPEGYLIEARVCFDAGDFDRLDGRLDDIARMFPNITETHFLRGGKYLYMKRFSEAVAELKEVIPYTSGESAQRLLSHLASAYYFSGDYAEAVQTCKQLIADKPFDITAIILLARALYADGRAEQAIRVLERCRDISGSADRAAGLALLGRLLYASSRIEEAARCFKEAAALNSDFVFFERFSTLSALGDIQTNSGGGFLKRMEAGYLIAYEKSGLTKWYRTAGTWRFCAEYENVGFHKCQNPSARVVLADKDGKPLFSTSVKLVPRSILPGQIFFDVFDLKECAADPFDIEGITLKGDWSNRDIA